MKIIKQSNIVLKQFDGASCSLSIPGRWKLNVILKKQIAYLQELSQKAWNKGSQEACQTSEYCSLGEQEKMDSRPNLPHDFS